MFQDLLRDLFARFHSQTFFHTRHIRPKYHYPQVVSIPVGLFVCVIHFGSALTIPTAIFKRTFSGLVLIVTSIYALPLRQQKSEIRITRRRFEELLRYAEARL